jgi:hypothetical protein
VFKAAAPGKDGARVLMLGLSRLNAERLLSGKPIVVNAPEMIAMGFPAMTVALLGGETEDSILEEIRSAGQEVVNRGWQRADGPAAGAGGGGVGG